jgi:hypothetical protein
MTQQQREWARACGDLVREITDLGYPGQFGKDIAKMLGSPKAINRMTAYLRYARPESAEIIADEVLALRSEIDEWKRKKSAQEANMRYNEILSCGVDPDGSDE